VSRNRKTSRFEALKVSAFETLKLVRENKYSFPPRLLIIYTVDHIFLRSILKYYISGFHAIWASVELCLNMVLCRW